MPYCFANDYVATDFANGFTKILFWDAELPAPYILDRWVEKGRLRFSDYIVTSNM